MIFLPMSLCLLLGFTHFAVKIRYLYTRSNIIFIIIYYVKDQVKTKGVNIGGKDVTVPPGSGARGCP